MPRRYKQLVGDYLKDDTSFTPKGTPLSEQAAQELEVPPELEEKLNEVRKKNVGRPPKSLGGKPKPLEFRATFVVNPDLVRKLKYISIVETKLYKETITEALTLYIKNWERKNGELPNLSKEPTK